MIEYSLLSLEAVDLTPVFVQHLEGMTLRSNFSAGISLLLGGQG